MSGAIDCATLFLGVFAHTTIVKLKVRVNRRRLPNTASISPCEHLHLKPKQLIITRRPSCESSYLTLRTSLVSFRILGPMHARSARGILDGAGAECRLDTFDLAFSCSLRLKIASTIGICFSDCAPAGSYPGAKTTEAKLYSLAIRSSESVAFSIPSNRLVNSSSRAPRN